MEARYKDQFDSALRGMILADEDALMRKQVEVQTIERMIGIPYRLLEKPKPEE